MGIVLDQKTVSRLDASALPVGKTEKLFWDSLTKGFGLRLRVGHDGKLMRRWVVQYRHDGQQRRTGIGDANRLNADQARKKATALLGKVLDGRDPAAEKKARRAETSLTFSAAVNQYLDLKKLTVRDSSLRLSTLYLTRPQYFAPLHRMPLTKITQSAVATRLDVIHIVSGATSASRARAHLSAFFVWCLKRGHCSQNPVINTEAQKQGPARDRVLSDGELAAIWKACKDDEYGRIVRLLILTGCRRQEIGGLRWSEIDLEQGTMTITGTRTKNGRELVLPLTGLMRSIIESVPNMLSRDPLFGQRAEGFTSWQKARLDHGISKPWRLHDIRRSVATGMADLGIQPHVIEAILNHVSGHKAGVAGIYNRSTYAREMKNALAVWSAHVESIVTGSERKVVNFQKL